MTLVTTVLKKPFYYVDGSNLASMILATFLESSKVDTSLDDINFILFTDLKINSNL